MHRLVLGAGLIGVTFVAVACGSGAAATPSNAAAGTAGPSASASPGRGLGRNANAGELVQINGTTLVLNTQQGDVKVTFVATTPVSKTSSAALADIAAGVCIVATGQKDAAGAITADTVNITDPVNGSCAANANPGGGPGRSPNPSFSPDPNRTPPAGQQNAARARGQVTAVSGVSLTLTQVGGTASGPLTITVPTTVTVNKTASATPADLSVGSCVAAIGQKDPSGTVAARSLSIVPAGPTGCFTGGRAGAFGGGFPGGGGGGGGGAGAGNG